MIVNTVPTTHPIGKKAKLTMTYERCGERIETKEFDQVDEHIYDLTTQIVTNDLNRKEEKQPRIHLTELEKVVKNEKKMENPIDKMINDLRHLFWSVFIGSVITVLFLVFMHYGPCGTLFLNTLQKYPVLIVIVMIVVVNFIVGKINP